MEAINSMERMISFSYVDLTDLVALRRSLSSAMNSEAKSVVILSCSSNNYDIQDLNSILSSCALPIFGGIFPGIIFKGELKQQGSLIISINIALESATFSNISDAGTNLISDIQQQYHKLSQHKNFLMFVDSLSDRSEEFIDLFYEIFGDGINVIGGGAGSLMMSKSPTLFTNQGLAADAVQIIGLPSALRTQSSHGWEIADGPFLVTQSEKNHLISLNYQPAFQLYSQSIEKIAKEPLTNGNFIKLAKRYPLGIQNISGELLIRDPIFTNNNELFCVGDVPSNFMVYVLKSSNEQLIESAQYAALNAKAARDLHSGQKLDIAIVFDCISRFLYMGDEYSKELKAIQDGLGRSQTMVGVMSLGEIANLSNGALAFMNKSTVVGSM